MDACALVCAVLRPRSRAQETGQATPGVTLACLVFGKGEEWPTSGRSPRTGAIVDGCSALGFQRNLELAFSNFSAPAEL